MKVVYVTSGIGMHVVAISDAYYSLLGNNFTFVCTRKPCLKNSIHQQAEQGISYQDKPYIYNAWTSLEAEKKAILMINSADVVIYGGLSFKFVEERLHECKLTFSSSERWFKKPFYLISPKGWFLLYKSIVKYQNPNYFHLALSAYCANDASFIHAFKNRIYKFGYIVPIEKYDVERCLRQKRREVLELMWCARFIDWKHPELVTNLARKLIHSGYRNFHITMVGADSPLQKKAITFIRNNNLDQCIRIVRGLPNAKTRELMKESNIFLITSDRKEGWGAVLNEAMGAGCAVVASNQIGSTPFLLKHNQNGLIFKSRSLKSLYDNVVRLIESQELREKLAIEAYHTISKEWSAENVADRFLKLAESILNGSVVSYVDGPCSLAAPCDANKILID